MRAPHIIFSQRRLLYVVLYISPSEVGNGISIFFLEQGQQHQTVREDILRKIRAKVPNGLGAILTLRLDFQKAKLLHEGKTTKTESKKSLNVKGA